MRQNYFGRLCRFGKIAPWLSITTLLVFATAAQAYSVGIGEQLSNGAFTSNLSSWTISPSNVNWRDVSDAINTATGVNGFDNAFTSGFAVLGDGDGAIAPNPSHQPASGTVLLSQAFTIDASDIVPLNPADTLNFFTLNVKFDYALDGDFDSGDSDNLSATLNGPSGIVNVLSPVATKQSGGDLSPVDFTTGMLTSLAFGTYTLTFTLFEDTGANRSSAAGIDNVTVTGSADLTLVPIPSAMWLLGSGLLGLSGFSRRKSMLPSV